MYLDFMLVYLIESEPPSEFLGTKCFAELKVYDSAFVTLAWQILPSLEPLGPHLFLTRTTRCWRISSFVCLVVIPQYH